MRIGTTPTNKFEIAEIGKEIPIELIKALKVTYRQNYRIILEKYKTDCQVETGKIILKLTQDETFKFDDTKSISIQIRILTENGDCFATDVITVSADECLDDEVLS